MGDFLEAMMIVLFGISWPITLVKQIRTKATKGLSVIFFVIADCAYVCGILGKIVGHSITWVFPFYLLNFTVIAVNIFVYCRNAHAEKNRAEKEDA